MNISVVLEKVEGDGYRATSVAPSGLVAEGKTRDEAIEALRAQIQVRLTGAELVQLNVDLPGESHSWTAIAGSWRDHPDRDELEQNLREYRQQVDAEPERL